MARAIRVEYEGALYHVTARGNERKEIYRSDEDRKMYLDVLGRTVEERGWRLHGYCLMNNHYHLLFSTPQANLSAGMKWLQTTYTIRFNRRHKRAGHLFQGRYKAQVLDTEAYAARALQYLHANPVRVAAWKKRSLEERMGYLDQYVWSSHRAYAGTATVPSWLLTEWLSYYGKTRQTSRRRYAATMREYVASPMERLWSRPQGGLVVGGEELWEKVKGLLGEKDQELEQPPIRREESERRRKRLNEQLKGEDDPRIILWARTVVGGEKKSQVAREYGYADGSAVTWNNRALEVKAKTDPALAKRLIEIQNS
jgi:REP element-mobilizing transposase RayT